MGPLYEHVKTELLRDIRSGLFAVGCRIPSEARLIERFKVSRITVRRAIRELIQDGYLEAYQGKGVFVRQATLERIRDREESVCNVALFLPNISKGVMPLIALETETQLFACQMGLEICNTDNSQERTFERIELLRRKRNIAGILFHPNHVELYDFENMRVLDAMEQTGLPVVLLDGYLEERACDAVVADNEAGAYALTRHLIRLGHRRIAIILENGTRSLLDRYAGYRRACEGAFGAVDPALTRRVDYLSEDLYHSAALDLLSLPERPTAIFASHDLIARGVYRAAEELGMCIPGDLSVAGFDDLEIAAAMSPPLTTVRQPIGEMCRQMVKVLLRRMRARDTRQRVRKVAAQLIERASCGAPPPEI